VRRERRQFIGRQIVKHPHRAGLRPPFRDRRGKNLIERLETDLVLGMQDLGPGDDQDIACRLTPRKIGQAILQGIEVLSVPFGKVERLPELSKRTADPVCVGEADLKTGADRRLPQLPAAPYARTEAGGRYRRVDNLPTRSATRRASWLLAYAAKTAIVIVGVVILAGRATSPTRPSPAMMRRAPRSRRPGVGTVYSR
jgi:hypothetical protein